MNFGKEKIKTGGEIEEEKEKEIREKVRTILSEKETEKALKILVEEISKSVSDEDWENFVKKIGEYRQSKPVE